MYAITQIEPCATCDEAGWVMNPVWARYFDTFSEDPGRGVMYAWFREQGLVVYCDEDLPPELVMCDECEGLGYITEDRDLVEVLQELGVLHA